MSIRSLMRSLLTAQCCLFASSLLAQQASTAGKSSVVGDALRVVFNPVVAPDAKTMGMVQRNSSFLKEIASVQRKLELALVIDGTTSMEEEIDGVKTSIGQMLDNIRMVSGKRVSVQIVVYRDSGSPSGRVSFPSNNAAPAAPPSQWMTDPTQVAATINSIVPEDGAPYFHECVDEGIYSALTELAWSTGNDSTRWILVVGDAPPLAEGFNEPENKAKRHFLTSQLISIANDKRIQINAILCPTRRKDAEIYKSVVVDLKSFFQDLTTDTQGIMLDLHEPQMQREIRDRAQRAVKDFQAIEPIRQEEIAQLQASLSTQAKATPKPKMRIAVLPHLERERMDFSLTHPAVVLANEIRSQLDNAGIQTIKQKDVEEAFFELQDRIKAQEDFFREFGKRLKADIVIWGQPSPGNPNVIQSLAIDVAQGKEFARATPSVTGKKTTQLCSALLEELATKASVSQPKSQFTLSMPTKFQFRTRLVGLNDTPDTSASFEKLVITARGYMERALEYTVDKEHVGESMKLYEEARKLLDQAMAIKKLEDPVVLSMLANLEFGEWQLEQMDTSKINSRKLVNAQELSVEAVKYKGSAARADQTEIEADSKFYRGEFKEAVDGYEILINAVPAASQVLRAHWMLLGIRSGDWGVAKSKPELVNATKAREHALHILAKFENEPEAKLLRKWLMLDGSKPQSSANLPLSHPDLVPGK